jgi:hypothetical protein
MPPHYAALRKKPVTAYRQRLLLGMFPLPGTEPRKPPLNHHGVDLATIRKKRELNRSAIREGKVVYPGLGVSKHPMTIVTLSATYLVGWALRDGTRPISVVGESSLPDGIILYLCMDEPMVLTGIGGMVCITEPVIFIGRRVYQGIDVAAPVTEIPQMRHNLAQLAGET